MTASPSVESKPTPMMQQWHACKEKSQDALLLFRMGDFYEAFYEDAEALAKELELTLTKRQGIPMSGVPVHTCQSYIDRLVARGYKVAVAEQMEDPKKTKGIVKRDIARFVTPGTILDSSLLQEKTNNYFVAIIQEGNSYGLAYLDLSTGEFKASEWENAQELFAEVYRLKPAEVLTAKKSFEKNKEHFEELKQQWSVGTTVLDDWRFSYQMAYDFLTQTFHVQVLDGLGFKGKPSAINAAGTLGLYITESLCLPFNHVEPVTSYSAIDCLTLDQTTLRNLELCESLEDRTRKGTLLDVIDQTATPMGGRLLVQWLKRPLVNCQAIESRLESVQEWVDHPEALADIRSKLSGVRDLERLMMRIHSGYATPRDLVGLQQSLERVELLSQLTNQIRSPLTHEQFSKLCSSKSLRLEIEQALVEDPPMRVGEGSAFKKGYSAELDELREIKTKGSEWLVAYQTQLREETGIKTLKVGYTRAFGYYIDVSRAQSQHMPASFQRRQTLTNNERFISPELKAYEDKVLHAEEKIHALEHELFAVLEDKAIQEGHRVLQTARALATIDVLASFAQQATQSHYVRPVVDLSRELHIEEGRHPVVERLTQEAFVANDVLLNDKEQQLILLTGPNMAGKSTYIRQIALIVILAQMGSFVPARRAHIGICDKVFTRIGASDNLAKGQSTFMVEMSETAYILNHATDRSLVILDEIGRGTSTYDGISIAWSVAEYLLNETGRQARTLFATHYWELTQLESRISKAKNYNVAVSESESGIVFLRKIVRGGTDKSYGIHVAKLAGLPLPVITRAQQLLCHLEEEGAEVKKERQTVVVNKKGSRKKKIPENQLFLL